MKNDLELINEDTLLKIRVQRLYRLVTLGRWLVVIVLWLTIGIFSIWSLRREISLWLEYFTWSAVRYGLAYQRLATLGLGLCIGMTVAVSLWQSRNILWGLPRRERLQLENLVRQVSQKGPRHCLWRWVIKDSAPAVRSD